MHQTYMSHMHQPSNPTRRPIRYVQEPPIIRLVEKRSIKPISAIGFQLISTITGQYILTTTNILHPLPRPAEYILYHMATETAHVVESESHGPLIIWYSIRPITDSDILSNVTAAIKKQLRTLGAQ